MGKTPLGRSRRRWVDDIKIDLGEVGWGGGVVLTGVVWLGIRTSEDLVRMR
jgi:hypothetical protein